MIEYYISSNSNYTSENDNYYKNSLSLTDDQGNPINDATFKLMIRKEVASFIHKTFSNIIVLVGAGASVLCSSGTIDSRYGKTVFMLAELINNALKQDINLFTPQELAAFCKYVSV